jgi:hypothetical protein
LLCDIVDNNEEISVPMKTIRLDVDGLVELASIGTAHAQKDLTTEGKERNPKRKAGLAGRWPARSQVGNFVKTCPSQCANWHEGKRLNAPDRFGCHPSNGLRTSAGTFCKDHDMVKIEGKEKGITMRKQ